MKKRYVYALLFGMPGIFIAGLIAILMFAGLTGLLWIYVLGDDPWPLYAQQFLSALFVITVLVLWIASIILGYLVGRRLEKDPILNKTHVWLSVGLTLAFILLMILQQWSIGNLGPAQDSSLCSDFCTMHGYSGSGMPPEISGDRTCSCYDDSGNEVLRIPLDHLGPDFQR